MLRLTEQNLQTNVTPEKREARDAKTSISKHTIYRDERREWDQYNAAKAKLRTQILDTVAQTRKATLLPEHPIRRWLNSLRTKTALPVETVRRNIQLEYRRHIGVAYAEWPSGGPATWLARWEELLTRAERYEEPLPMWLREICMVWERVPALATYINTVQMDIQMNNTAAHTPSIVSGMIQNFYELRKQSSSLRLMNRPKATRSAFATQGVTYDGEEAPEIAAAAADTTGSKGKGKSRGRKSKSRPNDRSRSRSRTRSPRPARSSRRQTRARSPYYTRSSRRRSNTRSPPPAHSSRPPSDNRSRSRSPRLGRPAKRDQKRAARDPCSACDGKSQNFDRCFLVLEVEKPWITDESRETFKENLKEADFKKRVEDARANYE